MKVLNPEGVVRNPQRSAGRLAPGLTELNGKVIGVLDDGFSGSEYYMRGVVGLIEQAFPDAEARYWLKAFHTRPAPEELISEIAEQADAVIVGIAG